MSTVFFKVFYIYSFHFEPAVSESWAPPPPPVLINSYKLLSYANSTIIYSQLYCGSTIRNTPPNKWILPVHNKWTLRFWPPSVCKDTSLLHQSRASWMVSNTCESDKVVPLLTSEGSSSVPVPSPEVVACSWSHVAWFMLQRFNCDSLVTV